MEDFRVCEYCGLKFREQFISDEILFDFCAIQEMNFCSMECYNNYESDIGFDKKEED